MGLSSFQLGLLLGGAVFGALGFMLAITITRIQTWWRFHPRRHGVHDPTAQRLRRLSR